MLKTLRNIPSICNIRSDREGCSWRMSVDGHPARTEIIRGLLSISLFLDEEERVPSSCLYSLTLLLAAHPDIHDYAIQLTPEGGWLNGYYGKNLSTEKISIEIEKHLALTRYLKSVIRKHQQCCSCGSRL